MKYQDPMPCQCPSCGAKCLLPVRELMALTAECPECHASLNSIGLRMRETADQRAVSLKLMLIVDAIGDQLGIEPGLEIEERVIGKLGGDRSLTWTLRDLVTALTPLFWPENPGAALEAVLAAVRKDHPDAPEPLALDVPLLDALDERSS